MSSAISSLPTMHLPVSLQQLYTNAISSLPPSIRESRLFAASLAGISIIGLSRVLSSLRAEYGIWHRLGASRFPHNPLGFLMAQLCRPLALEPRSTAPYAALRAGSKLENTSFLASTGFALTNGTESTEFLDANTVLPPRPGPRPTVGRHVLPNRQIDMIATASLRESLVAAMNQLARDDSKTLEAGESIIEHHGPALFLRQEMMEWAARHDRFKGAPSEIAHVHLLEGSMHVFLSARDAEIVLMQGWGERHPMSGQGLMKFVGGSLGRGFVLLYAPRDEKEVEAIMKIVRASVRYAAEGRAAV